MKQTLNITHIKSLTNALGCTPEFLQGLIDNDDNYVKVLLPKKNKIDAPKNDLKKIQQRIYKRLLINIPISSAAHGWIKSKSRISMTRPHINKRHTYKFDIKNFFKSFRFMHVFKLLNKELRCSPSVAYILAKLLIYKKSVPFGSPASHYLSNIFLKPFDEYMLKYANIHDAVYTRFGDDFIISSNKSMPNVISIVDHELGKLCLKVNQTKSKPDINTKKSSVSVLGLNLSKKASISKKERKRLAIIIHASFYTGLNAQNRIAHKNFRKHLEGKIQQVQILHPQEGTLLLEKLKQIPD